MSNIGMSSWIKEVPPLEKDKKNGWRPYHIFSGSTHCMDELSSYISILSPGITPHEPHSHPEEELLIILSGEADIVRPDKKIKNIESREIIRPRLICILPCISTSHNQQCKHKTSNLSHVQMAITKDIQKKPPKNQNLQLQQRPQT